MRTERRGILLEDHEDNGGLIVSDVYSIPTENNLTFGNMAATGIVATLTVSCCVQIIIVSGIIPLLIPT
jgi:cell division protein FtsW (lipid II flippase)